MRLYLSDNAKQHNMFSNKVVEDNPNTDNVTIKKNGLNAVRLVGTKSTNNNLVIAEHLGNFVTGRKYTIFIYTENGNPDLRFYFIGFKYGVSHTNASAIINYLYVLEAAEDNNNVYVQLTKNVSTDPYNVTGDYTIFIAEGEWTKEQILGMQYLPNNYDNDHLYSFLRLSDEAKANNIVKGKIIDINGTTDQISVTPIGFNSLHLEGTKTSQYVFKLIDALPSFTKGKKYSVAIFTENGNSSMLVYVAGLIIGETFYNASVRADNFIHTFTATQTSNTSALQLAAIPSGGESYDVTGDYTIFIAEGEWTKEQILGMVYKDELDYNAYKEVNLISTIPVGLPILALTGNIQAATKDDKVNIDYAYADRNNSYAGTGNLKWQGASSLQYDKKNYTINKLTPTLNFLDWGDRKKFVLKANYIDFSHARNVCCARLWKGIVQTRLPENTRLINLPNCGAIDGFPIMVTLNGKYNGLYTLTTSKDEGLFNMGSGEYECILSAEDHSAATRLYRTTTLEEIQAESTFGFEYIPDEENPEWAVDSLNALITACINVHDAAGYSSLCENLIDVDSAIDYMIFAVLLGGMDIWDKNYLLSTFDGTKWFFSVYDLDTTFGNHWTGASYYNVETNPTFSQITKINSGNRLFYLINKYDKAKLKARFQEIVDGPMSERTVMNVFSNFMSPIPKALKDYEVKLWPKLPGTDTNDLAQITNWYRLRLEYAKEEIEEL